MRFRPGSSPLRSPFARANRPRLIAMIAAASLAGLGVAQAGPGGGVPTDGPAGETTERTAGYRPSAGATPELSAKRANEPDGKPEAGRWVEDVETARVTAAATDRPVVLHFHAVWCRPCKQME
ncbi:MAG: hypothetical protein AAF907_06200, partial [Planctomycetota bacterium]